MTEIILTILIAALLGFIYLKDKEHNIQVNKLIKGIIAKHSTDYSNMTLSESTKMEMSTPPLGPIDDDLIPLSSATDDMFDTAIVEDLKADVENSQDAK